MRIQLRSWSGERPLFFTAGNLPTQQAYSLTGEEVMDAFVVSLLRSDQVLLAASFYFESAATRALVRHFPTVWRATANAALFFINTAYPTVLDHGLGKIDKSPISFKPYSDPKQVRRRGIDLDRLGQVGIRDDVDISATIAGAWVRSCTSSERGSVGAILRAKVDPSAMAAATVVCVNLAELRQHDFIWPSIEAEIRSNPVLAPVYGDLRRTLADLYAETMSITLGAVQTTPALTLTALPLTERGIGHLGRFSSVLRRVGIDPRMVREDAKLLGLLQLDELALLRRLDDEVLRSALELQESANELWRAISLSEEREHFRPQLSDLDVRRSLASACDAVGVKASDGLLARVTAVQRLYGGAFLHCFRNRVQEILEHRLKLQVPPHRQASPEIAFQQQVLLFVTADPSVGTPSMRLETDRELKAIKSALSNFGDRSALQVVDISSIEAREIQPALLHHRPRFFHFSGHGDADGRVFLQAPERGVVHVNIDAILDALSLVPVPVECALFNSCYSLSALDKLQPKGVHYLILAAGRIPDEEARAFSSGFYLALAAGFGVREAFALGRVELAIANFDTDLLQLFERIDDPGTAAPYESNPQGGECRTSYRRIS